MMEDKGDQLMNGHDVALLLSAQNPFNLPQMMLVDTPESALTLPSSNNNSGPVINLLNPTSAETQLINALNGINSIHLPNGMNGLPTLHINGTSPTPVEAPRPQLQIVSTTSLEKSQPRDTDDNLDSENGEVTIVDGVVYNNRGYEVCGQLNQHSKPCQRIGKCPFHKTKTGESEKKDKLRQKGPYKQGWTKEEHMRFLNGLQLHGKGAWKEISLIVSTRTPTQIQSHAQKYYLRQKQEIKNKRSIHDVSLEDLQTLSDNSLRPQQNGAQKNGNNSVNVSRPIPQLACPNIALVNTPQTPQFQLSSDQFPIVFATNPIINPGGGLGQFPYPFLSPAGFPAKFINFGDTFPISHLIAPPTLTLSQDPIDSNVTRNLLGLSDVTEESDIQNNLLLQLTQTLQKPDDLSNLTPPKSGKSPKHNQAAQQPINLLRPLNGEPKPRQNNGTIHLPQLVLQPQPQQPSRQPSPSPQPQPLQLSITTSPNTLVLDKEDDLGSTTLSLQFPLTSNDKVTKRKFDLLFDDHRTEKSPKLSSHHHQHDISSYI
eukprot:TRINITY_DN6189_c0_g1_i1.p1 TRINITY_DN6189_c0_g1~~TRINITY_DN6189_c0_g1_i1.p1  ORF type:complete len:542 (-),score=79.47 TRINITY_DN6189_c0_g1_i1:99-1724(-)